MKDNFIEAGKIVNTHGIYGELRIQPWADTPDFLTGIEYYYIGGEPVKVISSKVHKGNVIVVLEGIDGIDAAIKMKNKVIRIKKDDIDLEDGRYFISDLIGLRADDADTGKNLGILSDILTLPSNNVYVIKGEREILVPAVPDFIIETNINKGYVKIRLIEGL